MKKKLLFSSSVVFIALVMAVGFSIAVDEKPIPGPMSVNEYPLPDPNWKLKSSSQPEHTEGFVPLEEPGSSGHYSNGVIPSDDEIAQKMAQGQQPIAKHYSPSLKTNPYQGSSDYVPNPQRADLLFEGFEGGMIPPTDWTVVVNNSYTFEIDDGNPFEGSYNATCFYDENLTDTQDEWLISPSVDLTTGGTAWTLNFAWMGSYYWSIDPYDNYDMEIWISIDGGANFDVLLWSEADAGIFESFIWSEVTIPLTSYLSYNDVKFGIRYYGYDGAQFSVDVFSIDDNILPVGRACYGDPANPSCEDGITEADAAALGGYWVEGLNCIDDPCPLAPENDTWEYATPITGPFPVVIQGTTEGATVDCPGVLDWDGVWYVFDAPYALNNIDINYCGTVPGLEEAAIVLYADPVACDEYIMSTDYEWWDCGDGEENPHTWWDMLPGPATYYIPVTTGSAKGAQPFEFTINVTEPPPPEVGDWCDDPIVINIGAEGELPYTDVDQYTCGRVNYYEETCLGFYDGGEDIVYQLNVSADMTVDITLDPQGTTYTGILVDAACPADPSTCIATSTSSSSSPHSISGLYLTAGTYYIMVDTWPSPDCIPSFNLTIEEAAGPTPGDDCTDPIVIKFPADLPYADLSQSNCGRGNNYDNTCLSSYDSGEDIVYSIDVSEPITLDIIFDPKGTSYGGMLLDASCPADPTTCIATITGSSSDPKGFYGLHLEAGVYYLMIDTWASPDCIPDFDLTIALAAGPQPGDDWELCEEIGDVTEQPFTTIGSTPDGPQGCLSSPNIWYCYTATCTGFTTVSLCGSSYDTKMAVYDGVDPSTADMLGCNDDFCTLQSEITFASVEGNTYLIEVGGFGSNTGDGIITVDCVECDPPSNDNCEDVTPVTLTLGTSVTFTGDNTCASNQCPDFEGGHVWEAFTITQSANVTLDYCGTSPAFGNAWLNLALGCPCGEFTTAGTFNTDDCGDDNVTIVWDGLAPGTYYYPVMLDPASDAEGPYTINVVAEAVVGHCTASGGCDEYISRVAIGSIDNSSGCDNYGDYKSLSTLLEIGDSAPLTIEIGGGYSSDYGAVWIDWNQDFVFDEVTEAVTLDTYSGSGPYSGTVTVPGDAVVGSCVMRVRLNYSSLPGPCGTTSWGEVEDYTIEVGGELAPTFLFDPDTVSVVMKYTLETMMGHVIISDAYTADLGHAVTDIDAASVTITVTNSSCSVPLSGTPEVLATYPDLTGQVLDVEFPIYDFIVCEENGFLLWDENICNYTVAWTYGGGAGSADLTSWVMIRSHRSGDLNLDGLVSISDVTFFVAYLFSGGDVPLVIETADVNLNGNADISDLTYLVAYMFNNGPEPIQK